MAAKKKFSLLCSFVEEIGNEGFCRKRSMRIFGSSRALRSGRRLWPVPFVQAYHKETADAATKPQGCIHLLQELINGGGTDRMEKNPDDSTVEEVVTPMDIDDKAKKPTPPFLFEQQNRPNPGDSSGSKLKPIKVLQVYKRKRNRYWRNLMFGKKYFRKRRRIIDGSSSSLNAESAMGDRSGWLSSILILIFRYMMFKKSDLELSTLKSLVLSAPLSIAFSSRGVNFTFEPSWFRRRRSSRCCKIYGSNCSTPLFTLVSSALPYCFMYLHTDLLLQNSRGGLTMKDESSSLEGDDNDLTSSDLFIKLPIVFPKKIRAKNRKPRKYKKPPVRSYVLRSKNLKEDNDPNVCRANIVIFEKEANRVNGVMIKLGRSALRKWSITVSKDRLIRFNFHSLQKMSPYHIDCSTHVVTWRDNRYNWELEFVDDRQWYKFKEMYRVCYERNSPFDVPVNVPIYREVANYDDDFHGIVPFQRTGSYVRIGDDELTRLSKRKTTVYDMDSDDEEWLENFNGESSAGLSKENFEMIVDASEETLSRYPREEDASNLYVDMENRDVVEAVFRFWKGKRKGSNSSLCRIYKMYEQVRDRLQMKRVVRKKRTYYGRIRRQPELGMGMGMGKGMLPQKRIGGVHKEEKVVKRMKVVNKKNDKSKVLYGEMKAKVLMEIAIKKRRHAQMLMMSADMATYKALEALRIAAAVAQVTE